MNLEILFLMMFFSVLLTVIFQRQHLLMVLLSLEGLTLMLIIILVSYLSNMAYMDVYLFVIVLSFGAIEASLGLALLVSMTRKSGSDLISSLTLSKC